MIGQMQVLDLHNVHLAQLSLLEHKEELLAEAGRARKDYWLSKRIYIAVDDDEKRARQKLTEVLNYQYAGRDQSQVGLATTPSGAVEWLGRFREAGAEHVLLHPCYDHAAQMELLATKVIPQL